MKWSEYPFLRLTIAIVLGILLNSLVKGDDFLCYLLLMFYVLFFCIYFISFWRRTTKFGKKYEGFLTLSSFMLLGYMTSQLIFVMEKPQFSQEELKSGSHYTISLISNPAKTDKTTKYEAIIDKIKINEVWFDVDEKQSFI